MLIKNLSLAAALIVMVFWQGTVAAHGTAAAKHGGVAQMASDLSFELVGRQDGAVIFIEDHGQPMSTTGMSGKLTVLNGTEKSEAPLVSVGEKLEATGILIKSGSKVIAQIKTSPQTTVSVRFSVK